MRAMRGAEYGSMTRGTNFPCLQAPVFRREVRTLGFADSDSNENWRNKIGDEQITKIKHTGSGR